MTWNAATPPASTACWRGWRATRHVGRKIIDFLAQLEDFQKRLWLKKKFVLETHWCVTLDRVPAALYPEIAANAAQCREWVELFAADQITGDLTTGNVAWTDPRRSTFSRRTLTWW